MGRASKRGVLRSLLSVVALATLFASACTTTSTTAPAPSFAASIDSEIVRPPFDRAFWSILVEEDDGTVLYTRNSDKLTIPASNRKLFSSATIASCLGTEARLSTELWLDGGDVILRGGGDPSLGSWRYERSDDFDKLAKLLVDRNVLQVRDVVADVSLFDRETIPGGWKHGNIGSDYAAPVDALAWGESELPGDRAADDAALHAASALREALHARGIAIAGVARANTEPRAWSERVASIDSPFVGHLLTTVLKNSHNLYTEMLLKRLGAGPQATYESALEVERAFLVTEVGLEPDSFRFVDGSGLAPDDLVTPEATVRMLRWMNHPARRQFWWSVLAQPNDAGTLRRRVVALEHRMRGKTGTINGVNALSGIVAMPDGRFRYFSAVVNHHDGDGDEAEKILDRIASLVGGS
jgi:D-alanyl-D-alanine carboxypeptidase/D-alanyl-D-alanine-endopeptidase (penicillin-binding protein 4)